MLVYFVIFIALIFLLNNSKIISSNVDDGNIKKIKSRYSYLFSPGSISPRRSISSIDSSTSSDELYDYKQINSQFPRTRSPTRPILK